MTNAYTSLRDTASKRATERVSKMRPIDQIALFDALRENLPTAGFRELKTKSVYDDRESYPVFVCPWCREHLHEGDVVVVETGVRDTVSGETSPEDGVTFDHYDDDDQNLATQALYYKCGNCNAPVTVPSHIQVIWG
jgi:hypothetical protein